LREIAAFARRPVRRCNGGTIDAENERNRIAVALLLDKLIRFGSWKFTKRSLALTTSRRFRRFV